MIVKGLDGTLNILFFNYEFLPIGGGGSVVTKYLGESLAAEHHSVSLITSGYKGLKPVETLNGVHIRRVPVIRKKPDYTSLFEMFTYMISGFWRGFRSVSKHRPDIMHGFFVLPSGVIPYMINKFYKIPYVIYLGGSDVPGIDQKRYGFVYSLVTPLIRRIWKNASAVVAASDGLIEHARKIAPKISILKIPNGVDRIRFQPTHRKKAKDAPVRILAIGRLIKRKGFEVLIQAGALLHKQGVAGFEIVVVGTGATATDLKQLARKSNIANITSFPGSIPYNELHTVYQDADIFVNTSYGEGMPCVVLEAISCGLPVIATLVPGNKELVEEGKNGYLVTYKNVQELATHLRHLIEDSSLRKRMGKESEIIAEQYDWSAISKRYLQLYQDILGGKSLS